MEDEPIKQKIEAETLALLPLKVDNQEVVNYKFRSIRDQVAELRSLVPQEMDSYAKALTRIEAAMNTEYKQFNESTHHDEKEQALIQLKHIAAEVCELLRTA